ncbi:MAG TPA: transketolase [Candidatus Thermoplasmatota archaeon]|nr:transketolase [Candidatus Thermoplasmatota archaeon]
MATLLPPRTADRAELARVARQIRVDTLKMTYAAGSGHPGGSMSEAEILSALYFGGELRVDPKDPRAADRDRFILSKGHCCPGLYSVLAQRGFFPREELWNFRRVGHLLQGHSDNKVPGVDMSAGSLGMGLSFGNGVALMARMENKDRRTYVLLGDGECQEGSIWEAAMTSAHQRIENLCAIVDYNKIQIEGFVKDIKNPEPFADKWEAFGWNAIEIDGHDFGEIMDAFEEARTTKGIPTVIIAHTLKGKGVSFTENKNEYHGRALTEDEMKRAMAELKEPWP